METPNEHAGIPALTNEDLNKRSEQVMDDFASFIEELENDEKNDNANCNLEGDDCLECGS